MKPSYQPERGDVIWLDFSPNAGTEQGGRRPALVMSDKNFNIATGLIFACPVTTKGKGSRFEVPLPRGISVQGFILTDQLRSLDWIARSADFIGKVTSDDMAEVIGRIEAIMGVYLAD